MDTQRDIDEAVMEVQAEIIANYEKWLAEFLGIRMARVPAGMPHHQPNSLMPSPPDAAQMAMMQRGAPLTQPRPTPIAPNPYRGY